MLCTIVFAVVDFHLQVTTELSESIEDVPPLSLAAAASDLTMQCDECLTSLSNEPVGLQNFDRIHDLNRHVSELLTDEERERVLRSTSPNMYQRSVF